jgi:hypothetical protein
MGIQKMIDDRILARKRDLQVDLEASQMVFADGVVVTPYLEQTLTVAANDILDVFVNFSYFRFISQTSTGLLIRFGNQTNTTPFTGVGLGLNLNYRLTRFQLINPTGAPITVTVATCDGQISDDRLTVSSALQPATPGTRATGQVSVTNAALQIVAANTTRKSVIIRNDPAAALPLYVGNAGVTTATGFLVDVGQSLVLESSGAVFGIRSAATPGNVFFIDESF